MMPERFEPGKKNGSYPGYPGHSLDLKGPVIDNRIYKGWIHFTIHYILGSIVYRPSLRGLGDVFFYPPIPNRDIGDALR